MKVIGMLAVYWVMALCIFWSYGCSLTQPVAMEEKPPQYAKQEEPLPITPEEKYLTHKIKWSGENLIRISWWYTGSGNNWLPIAKANPLIDPRRMKIGDSILVPENLLKTREPMPINYRGPVAIKKTKSSEPSREESIPTTREVELFGPIDIETQTDLPGSVHSPLPLETIE